jgi:heme/copper-type cytochrome/quinol oxidase subunit 4
MVIVAWTALMGGTILSWYLGDGHGPAQLATVGVLLVAFLKVYLVGRYFMELKDAPKAQHGMFAGWTIAMCAVLVAMYLFGL